MLQVVLKNYGYYTAKIDGDFGPASKKALKEFQSSNNLVSDGILGKNTCKKLNNKANVVKKSVNTAKSIKNRWWTLSGYLQAGPPWPSSP